MQSDKPEAIIYIPGLTQRGDRDKSIHSFAYRIKKAIDINYPQGAYKFAVEMQKRSFGKDNTMECTMASIYRHEKEGKVPVCHIYELDYANELVERFEKQNALVKTLWLFNALVSKFPRILYVTLNSRVSGISFKDKFQTYVVTFILFCLSVYGVILVSALLAAIGSKINFQQFPSLSDEIHFPKGNVPSYLHSTVDVVSTFFNYVYDFFASIFHLIGSFISVYKKYILSSAAVVLLLLPNLKNFITNIATDYLCMINYFNVGERRLTIIGKLEELLEHMEEEGRDYSQVSLYSYSFGSVIAMDALFPYDGIVSYRVRSKIKSLVTIGCFFDFIRVYWPAYYSNRKESNVTLNSWYNIYSSVDVLSSNFRNDSESNEATIHIANNSLLPVNVPYNVNAPENVGFVDMCMLLGVRAHTMYWEDTEYSASCFTNLFEQMKRDHRLSLYHTTSLIKER